jgi:hypothetical protein
VEAKKPLLVLTRSALPCRGVVRYATIGRRNDRAPILFISIVANQFQKLSNLALRSKAGACGNAEVTHPPRFNGALQISARCYGDPSSRPDFLVAGIPKRAVERLDSDRSLCRRWDHHALSIFRKGRNDRGSAQPRPLVAVQRFKNQPPGRGACARDRPHGARKRKTLRPRRANPFCSQEK